MKKLRIHWLLWLMLLSKTSAYFGLTGRVRMRDVKNIDEEAAYMAMGEQDSAYRWNEKGYYIAPSSEYERVLLNPKSDTEPKTRGLRSKKNVGPRNSKVAVRTGRYLRNTGLPPNDRAWQTSESYRSQFRRISAYRRPPAQFHNARPNQSYARRHSTLYDGYYRSLTRVPRYPRPSYSTQQIQYFHDSPSFGDPDSNVALPRYLPHYFDFRPQDDTLYDKSTPMEGISLPTGTVGINRDYRKRNLELWSTVRTVGRTPEHLNDGRQVQGDYKLADDSAKTKTSDVERTHSFRRLDWRATDFGRSSHRELGKKEQEQYQVASKIKPLFVTKDIPSIMKFVGIDETGNAYAVEDIDPSSFSSPVMSEAGSRATDLASMVPSSDINKRHARKQCEDLRLTRKQRKLCKRDPGLPQVLQEATATSLAECQYQFRLERWNCSTGNTRIHLLSKGNRETAFLFAISSAGLTHSIARACAGGHLERCSCDETYSEPINKEAWMWGGCGDNVQFAVKFVRQFLKPKARNKDIRAEMDKHNSDLGIRVIKQTVKKTCKCHGVSGSCTTETCWRKVAPFYEIGEKIKGSYNRSVKVGSINSADGKPHLVRLRRMRRNGPELRWRISTLANETMLRRSTTSTLNARSDLDREKLNSSRKIGLGFRKELTHSLHPGRDNPRSNELIYLESSPQYCRRTRFSLGTRGRLCDKDRNCNKICCGRGYTQHTTIVKRSCACEVRWCCYVECKTCTEERVMYKCK